MLVTRDNQPSVRLLPGPTAHVQGSSAHEFDAVVTHAQHPGRATLLILFRPSPSPIFKCKKLVLKEVYQGPTAVSELVLSQIMCHFSLDI